VGWIKLAQNRVQSLYLFNIAIEPSVLHEKIALLVDISNYQSLKDPETRSLGFSFWDVI
jgi:hypothetical protein